MAAQKRLNAICALATAMVLFITAPASAQQVDARDDGVQRELARDGKIATNDGGLLAHGTGNVLVDRFGQCRWLDNNSAVHDYFVPTANVADMAAFFANKPADVRADGCCPALSATLTASDGQAVSLLLPVGRENSTGLFGVRDISHSFFVTRVSDGALVNEAVAEQYICQAGQWTGQGAVVTESVVP